MIKTGFINHVAVGTIEVGPSVPFDCGVIKMSTTSGNIRK